MRNVLALAAVVVVAACAQLGAPRELAYDRLSERDVTLAAATLQNTLETGDNHITVVWQNTVNGHAGATTPVRTFVTDSGCEAAVRLMVPQSRLTYNRSGLGGRHQAGRYGREW